MSHLVRLIDEYKAERGEPSDSSIARTIGVAPQTINSWRQRGIKRPPNATTLRALAKLIRQDYESVVLRAALLDAGWVDEEDDGTDEPPEMTGTT